MPRAISRRTIGAGAGPQLRLDHRQEVVGGVLVALGVGVPRDAEELARLDLHVGEEEVEVVRHDVLEQHERAPLADGQQARDAGADRHLRARERRVRVAGIADGHEEIQREIRDGGEGMRRVDGTAE
jgi:hypothetical protein